MRIFESTIVPTSQVDFGTVHSVIPDAHNIVLTCSHMPDETFVAFSNEAIGAGKVIIRATDIVPGYQLLNSGVPVTEIELPKGSIAIYTLNFRGDERLANVRIVGGGAGGVKPEDLVALAARTEAAESDIAQIKTEVSEESQALTALTRRVATVESQVVNVVTAETNPLTGRIRKSANGKPLLRSSSLMSGVETQSLGRNDAVATTSYHKVKGVAQPFTSIRLIVRNYGPSLESGKNSFAVAAIGAATDNVTSMTPVTWGGGKPTPYDAGLFKGTVAASAFSGHSEIAISDPIPVASIPRTDGQPGAMIAIRQVANGSVVYSVPGGGEHASEQVPSGIYISAMAQKSGDFVTTNQSGFGVPSFGAGLNIDTVDVVFGCDTSTLIVAQSGDSIEAGVLGLEGRGNGVRLACSDIAATGKPVSFANLAMPAGRVGTYTERAIQFIEKFAPAVVFYTPMTPNTDSGQIGESVNIAEAKAWLTQMVSACDLVGTHLVLCTCSPWYATTVAQDNGIKVFNAYLANFAVQFGFGFYDRYSLFSDGASPARLKAGYAGSDNAHPNAVAYEAERSVVRQILDSTLPF